MKQTFVPPQRTDEYDLQQNLKKVQPYQQRKPQRAARQTSDTCSEWVERSDNDRISSIMPTQEPNTSSRAWGQYTHLDDKISDFQVQNEIAHLQIRKDFDAKVGEEVKNLREDIESKLSTKWYSWTVAAIVAIVGLIYLLSYSRVLSTQSKHTDDIKDIQIEVNVIKNDVKTLQDNMNSLHKKEPAVSESKKSK